MAVKPKTTPRSKSPKREPELAEFIQALGELMSEAPDDCPGFVCLHPELAERSGRSVVNPLPYIDASGEPNKDGFPPYLNVGRCGRGAQLEELGNGERMQLSLGFERETGSKTSSIVGKWGKK